MDSGRPPSHPWPEALCTECGEPEAEEDFACYVCAAPLCGNCCEEDQSGNQRFYCQEHVK